MKENALTTLLFIVHEEHHQIKCYK